MKARVCPLCESAENELVARLEAAAFCGANWTYAPEFREILDLEDPAYFPIVRCRKCSMVYAGLLPDPSFLSAVYERVIRSTDCIAGSENRIGYTRRLRYVAELLDLAPATPRLRALDFGSGAGVTLRILSACEVEAVGVDSSASRNDYVQDRSLRVTTSLAEAGGPFDILVLDNVLEHLAHPVEVVGSLSTVTAPGAIAFVSVPPYEPAFLHSQVASHRRGEAIDMTFNPWEHLNYFSLAHLDVLMRRGRFRRLTASERAEMPAIGLRAERTSIRRWKNTAATMRRLARYAVRGEVGATAAHAFYRREA